MPAKTRRERNKAQRQLVERLWREGVDAYEIASQAGWSTDSPPATRIAIYRSRGWDLPHRHSAERVEAYTRARWPEKAA